MDKQIPIDPMDEIIEIIMGEIPLTIEVAENEKIEMIERVVFQSESYGAYSLIEKGKIAKRIFNRMFAYDVLQPLLEDPSITEIMCNGYKDIFVESSGTIEKIALEFKEDKQYKSLLQKIASDVNRKIDFSSPIVDARLKDGSRVNIVLDPVALNGPILTIRKFSAAVYSLEDLHRFGSFSEKAMDYLKNIVVNKKNIFISGGTGSGKTTLLNAMCKEINDHDRVITIEDSAEIKIHSIQNVVSLEKRNPNTEGTGEISIAQLIKTALRMRPDRIIVGEIRGAEAIDMLQAMNTGHSGSISTGHSNGPLDMLRRIETMVLCGLEIPIIAVQQQIASAIEVIIHIERQKNGKRRIVSISELKGFDNGKYDLVDIEI